MVLRAVQKQQLHPHRADSKNIRYSAPSPLRRGGGDHKPYKSRRKDPREIALALSAPAASYPACASAWRMGLCRTDKSSPRVLFAHHSHNTRRRAVAFSVQPLCLFQRALHSAQSAAYAHGDKNRKTYCRLADFSKAVPALFHRQQRRASRIAGGPYSLHFQGGRYVMPIDACRIRRYPALGGVRLAVLNWPMPALQLRGRDSGAIIDAADRITRGMG